VPAAAADRSPLGARDIVHGESDARSKRPLGTHRLLKRTLAAFHGVFYPSTLAEAGSDQHRVCLPGCAAPSGFLNLLTHYSACNLSGLVSCR
jgi:hypothetical protein